MAQLVVLNDDTLFSHKLYEQNDVNPQYHHNILTILISVIVMIALD